MSALRALKTLATHLSGDAVLEVDGNDLRAMVDELRAEHVALFRVTPNEPCPEQGPREIRYYGPGGELIVRRSPC